MTTRFLIGPKKISEIEGTDPTIFDTGCPNCIAPAYSGPCVAQACSPSISYDGTLPAFIDPNKTIPSEDIPENSSTPSENE